MLAADAGSPVPVWQRTRKLRDRMTALGGSALHKSLKSLAALALHATGPMSLARGCALAVLTLPALGHAQTMMCSGGLTGTVGLSIKNDSGGSTTVAANIVPNLFGAAECQCATTDIQMQIKLSGTIAAGTAGHAEVWVGTS